MADERAQAAQLIQKVLNVLPLGSLLHLEYEPVDGVRPEVAIAARVLNMGPTTYFVEYTGSSVSARGEPLLHGRVLNRGFGKRTFALLSGKLTKIDVLRRGPRPQD